MTVNSEWELAARTFHAGHAAHATELLHHAAHLARILHKLAHLAEPSPRDPERWQPLARAYLKLGAGFNPAP